MNITYLHTLPRQLGAKTFTVWFLLACAEQEQIVPASRQWLLDHMPAQTSPNTITAALRYLCDPENQIAVRVTGGWRLASAMQLPLELAQRVPFIPQGMLSEGLSTDLSTDLSTGPSQKRAERPFETSSSSSSAMEENNDSLLPPLLLPDQKRAERAFQVSAKSKEDRQACKTACREVGIHEPYASKIAALIWVTPNYIHDHVAEVLRCGQKIGLAIWRIMNEWDASPDKTDGQRYVEGDYAEYIEH